MEKNEAIGKPCNPLRQWKSIKAECQPKATKGAVMVEGLRQQSVPTRDDPQHETCAYQVSGMSRREATRPEEPRIGIKRKRIRNRPLPCQMPCSDRGIRSEEESVAIGRIRPEWYRQKNQYGWWVGRRVRKRELRQGSNGLSVRMSILPPLSGCSCSRVGHCSTQEQERPDSRP